MLCTILWLSLSPQGQAADTQLEAISLETALAKTLELNPALEQYPLYLRQADLKRVIALRAPASSISLSADNVLGSGRYKGSDSAEFSLLMSRRFERGDKAQRRAQRVDAKQAAQAQEYELAKLNSLADTRLHFVHLLRLQTLQAWAKDSIAQQQAALRTVNRLAEAGAINAADQSKMRLQLLESQGLATQLQQEQARQSFVLQSMWRNPKAQESLLTKLLWAEGQLPALPEAPNEAQLHAAIEQAPAYILKNAQLRLAESSLALAKSQAHSDIDVSFGLRRHQASSDQSLQFEVSMPLGQQARAQGDIKLAQSQWQIRQQAQALLRVQLSNQLLLLRQELMALREQLDLLQEQFLPAAKRYQKESKRAYELGQYSLLQWLDAQLQHRTMKRDIIEKQTEYWQRFIELERISGSLLQTAQRAQYKAKQQQDISS